MDGLMDGYGINRRKHFQEDILAVCELPAMMPIFLKQTILAKVLRHEITLSIIQSVLSSIKATTALRVVDLAPACRHR